MTLSTANNHLLATSPNGYGSEADHYADDPFLASNAAKSDEILVETSQTPPNQAGNGNSNEDLAQQARTASWLSIFFLITTDILGPTSAPYAVSQLGYIPGSLLFSLMGLAAGYTGYLLWRLYLALDSPETPVRSFSDLAVRLFGPRSRRIINLLQSLQLLFNVSVIILSNAQGLAQISTGSMCFSLLALIWAAAGLILNQVKQLKNFTYLSNLAIWMNFSVILLTMASVATSEPNYSGAAQQNNVKLGPISREFFVSVPFTAQVVGVMQIVYSYGGALMFIEFMAEMKNPREFWKSMISAQSIILSCYMIFGLFVYAYQGQFTINPANQGISNYKLQTLSNVLNLASALIAAGLYGNVGIKLFYQSVFVEFFNGPAQITSNSLWLAISCVYWAVAYLVASSIPQLNNISGLVAALCILQFSYTFPPLFMLAWQIQRDNKTQQNQGKSWLSRAFSALFSGREVPGKLFNLFLFLISCVMAGLGTYSSIQQIAQGFEQGGAASSFGCTAPV
jgi:hypothetical protein